MTSKLSDLLVREINDLVAISENLSRDAARSSAKLGPECVEEIAGVAVRGGEVIRRLYPADSQYAQNWKKVLGTESFTSMHSSYFGHLSEMVGILKAAQHDIMSGILTDFRRVVQAEVFADFLEMAEHLLGEGYKDPAAVLLGAVLEDSLRKLAVTSGLPIIGVSGKALTLEPLNVELAKTGKYGALVQKQVTTWANLRNDAAHGRFLNYDIEQVRHMLLFVQKFCSDYLV
jgi:hypothetical protein